MSHASHEACELKLDDEHPTIPDNSHASHEACELKFICPPRSHTPDTVTPRMRRVS